VALPRDPRFTKDMEKLPASSPYRQMMKAIDRHMLATDPPDHTRLRSLVSKAFTPRHVEELRPRITAISNQLLDAAGSHGSRDLLDAFAFPLPITVIAELLGVPVEDQDPFRDWTAIR
jgi:cytochrome P450 PksS